MLVSLFLSQYLSDKVIVGLPSPLTQDLLRVVTRMHTPESQGQESALVSASFQHFLRPSALTFFQPWDGLVPLGRLLCGHGLSLGCCLFPPVGE